jgi:hypothetical protein
MNVEMMLLAIDVESFSELPPNATSTKYMLSRSCTPNRLTDQTTWRDAERANAAPLH